MFEIKVKFETTVKSRQILRVDDSDYSLSFPVVIVAELEEKLGRSMKAPQNWLAMQTKEVETVLAAALKHYHPEEAAEVSRLVCTNLDPEELESVMDLLCCVACPRAMERMHAEIKKLQERVKKGLALPNAQSVDAR
ncbi:MAG TPA: hypothetical protein VFB43_17885 [Terracidiphilus sp.]|nr:hypothetical protein [Terracidiphilus sp.]